MATALELSSKRAGYEVVSDSGSGSEASKKAKVGSGDDYSALCSCAEFYERYGHVFHDPIAEWRRYLSDLEDECKLREIRLFLRSKGWVKEAAEIQSLDDLLSYCVPGSNEFTSKEWILRTDPGPYDDYQRLYAGDICYDDSGELMARFSHLYCTLASDLAYLEFFKELKSLITWGLSWSDAKKIGEDAAKKYKDLQPDIVGCAIQEVRELREFEQLDKESTPLLAKLWLEVVRKERDATEVLIEIIDNDAASFPASIDIIERMRWRSYQEKEHVPFIRDLETITRYIDAASKGAYLNDNEIKELIHKHHMEGPKVKLQYTYADCIEIKLAIAEKMGLTEVCAGFQKS